MGGSRPKTVVLVAGTGTEVGKTWVSARLLETWRAGGLSVAARKPAQSYEPGEGPTDAEVLGSASGEDPVTVCPPDRSYPVALAPPMAASSLGLPIPTVGDLLDGLVWPKPVDIGLVETAGGVRSPQAEDGDVIDLASILRPDHILLVADAGLGTINAVRLSAGALATAPDLPSPVVVLNRYDESSDLHRRNLVWLRDVDGFCIHVSDPSGIEAVARLVSGTNSGPNSPCDGP
jgi:dethiobiotin synthetase